MHTDVQQFNYIVKNIAKINSLSKEKTPPAIPPLFAPVGRCVASFRARQCSYLPYKVLRRVPPLFAIDMEAIG